MANSKLTDLTAETLPSYDDLAYIVDDPSGTPLARKVTVGNLIFPGTFSQTATVTVASTDSETTLAGAGQGTLTLPADFLVAGRALLIKAYGVVSDTGTPTLTMTFKVGSAEIATAAISTGGSLSNAGWDFEALVTCRTVGASGSIFINGLFRHLTTLTQMTSTAADTVDTTGTLALDLTATWSVSSASNTISCDNLVVTTLR